MLRPNLTPKQPYLNPEDMMMGKCLVCGSAVELIRWKCAKSRNPQDDLPIAECLTCKERSRFKSGTAVQMVKKQGA